MDRRRAAWVMVVQEVAIRCGIVDSFYSFAPEALEHVQDAVMAEAHALRLGLQPVNHVGCNLIGVVANSDCHRVIGSRHAGRRKILVRRYLRTVICWQTISWEKSWSIDLQKGL